MTADPIFVSLRCRTDNVGVLVHLPATGTTLAVDAPDADVLRETLEDRNWRLSHILVTHHHGDHTAGLAALCARFSAEVIGPAAEADRIAGLDRRVGGGDRLEIGGLTIDVLDLPGHTLGHVGYHLPAAATLFAGDTLFENGCGRLLEGTPAQMWASLARIAALPPQTMVFFGHDYGLANGRFALQVDPDNARLAAVVAEAATDAAQGRFRSHTTLAREAATNPFLRAGNPAIAERLGMSGRPAGEVFAELRARKDRA